MKRALFLLVTGSCLITFFLFLPFSSRITHATPNAIDPLFYAWNIMHNYQSAFHRFSDLMDTNIFYPEGNTLAFSDTLYAQTLLTAPVIAITKNPIFAQNLYVLSSFPLSAITMFLLSYYLTKHLWASALSGLFYAFSYPRLSQIGHMPAISSQWLPLYFLFLIKYLREGRRTNLIITFFWYLLSITSSVYFGIFLIPLTAIIFIIELVGKSWKSFIQILCDIAIIAIPAIFILFVALFPYIRLHAENPGIKRNLEDTAKLSAVPLDYLSVLPTSWLTDIGFPQNTNEHPLYPTLTVSILTIASIFFIKTYKKSLTGFLLLGFGALVLSFGPYADYSSDAPSLMKLPYYYLYKILPVFQSIRVPARLSIFVVLAFSVCASFTLSRLLKNPKSRIFACLVAMLFFTEVWQVQTPFVAIPGTLPPVYEWLSDQPDSDIIIELPMQPLPLNFTTMESQLMLSHSQLREDTIFATEAYRTYFSAFHRKRMLNGYSGFFPTSYHDQAMALATFPSDGTIAILKRKRVRYIIVHTDQYTVKPFSYYERLIREQPRLTKVQEFGNDFVYEIK